jgi:hypothetical protein
VVAVRTDSAATSSTATAAWATSPNPRPTPHPYAGDERLDRVLADLRANAQPYSATLAAEWRVGRSTAARIIRAARSLLRQ